ncbi:MAG: ferrochelatase [Bacteroidota bacterium]|nr:ferrochelatase [Bacteroidota bacterium]
MSKAVVLLNLGGPDSLKAVQPFLENLFNDPDIFKLPFQKKLAKYISTKRAPKVEYEYELIGGKSPLGEWTEWQRNSLEMKLRTLDQNIDVYTAMRYWLPSTADTAKIIAGKNYERVILLPLYPHYSMTTTGSSFNEWKRVSENLGITEYINSFYDHPLYIKALSERIDETLLTFPGEIREKVILLFSAHGTPVSYVRKGDPYSKQIAKTIKALMEYREDKEYYDISFQSKVGPARWLKPSTKEKIEELSDAGYTNLLVVPISFVSDHIETLYELNIEYRHIAERAGIENYIVMRGLNDSETFIDALFEITKIKL